MSSQEKLWVISAVVGVHLGALAISKLLSKPKKVEYLVTDAVAKPGGHYSPATTWGDQLFVSGILPFQQNGDEFHGSLEDQVKLALDNLTAVCKAGGTDVKNLIMTRVYVTDVEHWPRFNAVYKEYFGDIKPARAVVPVPHLHHGFLIEIEAVCAIIPK